MGSLSQIMEMIPGMGNASRKMPTDLDEDQIKRVEAIIQFHDPRKNGAGRKYSTAAGAGASPGAAAPPPPTSTA